MVVVGERESQQKNNDRQTIDVLLMVMVVVGNLHQPFCSREKVQRLIHA